MMGILVLRKNLSWSKSLFWRWFPPTAASTHTHIPIYMHHLATPPRSVPGPLPLTQLFPFLCLFLPLFPGRSITLMSPRSWISPSHRPGSASSRVCPHFLLLSCFRVGGWHHCHLSSCVSYCSSVPAMSVPVPQWVDIATSDSGPAASGLEPSPGVPPQLLASFSASWEGSCLCASLHPMPAASELSTQGSSLSMVPFLGLPASVQCCQAHLPQFNTGKPTQTQFMFTYLEKCCLYVQVKQLF